MTVPEWLLIGGSLGGVVVTWIGILIAIHRGIKAMQGWFEKSVVLPYVRPMGTDIREIREKQEESLQILHAHDKDIDYLKVEVASHKGILEFLQTTLNLNRKDS